MEYQEMHVLMYWQKLVFTIDTDKVAPAKEKDINPGNYIQLPRFIKKNCYLHHLDESGPI